MNTNKKKTNNLVYFCLVCCAIFLSIKSANFANKSSFLFPIWGFCVVGLGVLWASLGSFLGFLEAFFGGLWIQKPSKTHGFLRFLKMQLFGSLKFLMSLGFILASLWPFWFQTGPWNGSQKWFKQWSKSWSKMTPKNDQKVGKKSGPNRVHFLKKSLWPTSFWKDPAF